METMVKHTKRIIIIVLAVFFFLLGLLGLVLPFLQGFLFLAVAAVLFSVLSPRFRDWIQKYTIKYPRIHSIVERMETFVRRVVGDI
ncbi:MAG TPA: DUF454 family protein [Candidatus Paceibacterota bacterium]|nr:DUF454 family protein [Candidatus Paceibacterota bacterium]